MMAKPIRMMDGSDDGEVNALAITKFKNKKCFLFSNAKYRIK